MVKYVISLREEDREYLQTTRNKLRQKSKQELIELYNRELRTGIVGVRMQTLMLYALREVMLEVFGSSPVDWQNGMVLSLTGEARLSDGQLQIESKEE